MQLFLDEYGPIAGVVGLCFAIVGLLLAWGASVRVRALNARWGRVLEGTNSDSLEPILKEHLDMVLSHSRRLESTIDRVTSLETKMESSKRFLGLVRYDAFEDMGGAQSFALAIFDENGDGTVVTSQVGRSDCRVYAKELNGGRAERELSAEEKEAIDAAAKRRSLAGSRN